jgi:CRP/FNR family cyclic AMP-dependent transcriptional regulator
MAIAPAVLQKFPLLRDVSAETLTRLGAAMLERSFARREVVIKKGEPGNVLGFLIEGRLQGVDFTVDGREVGLYFVEANDYFGELSVIDGLPRPEFVIAVGRSRIATLARDEARKLFVSTPEIAQRITERLAQRLRLVSAQRILLSVPNPAQRVCAQLLQLTVKVPDGSAVITLAPTHQEIAIMINTSRETVTRVFQVLQARGILKRDGQRWVVADLTYLNDVAEGRQEPPKSA